MVEEKEDEGIVRLPDLQQILARDLLRDFFETHREQVFYSRQIEVRYEDQFFHWITNRALRDLSEEGFIRSEARALKTGGKIKLMWHKSFRFYKRSAARLVALVEEYADPNIGGALGLHGESMVLEGFARSRFVLMGRDVRQFNGKNWDKSEHDLDFIFERDSVAYGVEVKNILGYMDVREFEIKISLCKTLGVRPVFAARMLPRNWIRELIESGGYAMILKYQLYPWAHRELAKRVAQELGLPVDAPRRLEDGTIDRFVRWHTKNV